MGSRLAQVFLSSLVLWSVASAQTLAERNAELLRDLQEMHELSPEHRTGQSGYHSASPDTRAVHGETADPRRQLCEPRV
jgi:hypothetical protein